MKTSTPLLSRQDVIDWCYRPITELSLVNCTNDKRLKPFREAEKKWARSLLGGIGSQWTTELCQELVREVLVKLGRSNVHDVSLKRGSIGAKSYKPDLICDEFIYEVKGRNWTTPGTAGEKILGVPLKYGELPQLYKRPLKIILVGYQEYEAKKGFAFGDLLDNRHQTTELKEALEYFSNNGIEYVGLTDLLNAIDLHPSNSQTR